MNTKRPKKERRQVGLEISKKLNDLLDAAVAAFGGSRASNAVEVLDLCLPIWIEIKRQQKSDESERMRAALMVALSERFGWASDEDKAKIMDTFKKYGFLPETAELQAQEQEQPPQRKRK